MADMNFKIASNAPSAVTTVASPKVETSSVSKRTATKAPTDEQVTKQERVQEDNIERDIVAVSKDGDTVAVSKDSVADAKEIKTEDDRENVAYEETEPMEQIEAPELHPIEAPKIDETIDSYKGVSDERMEQMLAEGEIAQYDYKTDIMIYFSIPLGILAMVISGFFIFGFLENRRKRKQIYFILGGYLSSVNGTIQEIKQSITTISGRKGIEMIIKEEDKTSAVYYDEVFGNNPFKVGDSVSLQISESFIIEYEVNNG